MSNCQYFHLINTATSCRAMIQGDYFSPDRLTILYPGDVSDAIPYGFIRDEYKDSGGDLLATFSYLPLTYDNVENKTTIPFYIPSAETVLIPFTKYQGEEGSEPNKRNCWVYEVGITLSNGNGEKIVLIANSFVQVIPQV